MTGFAELEPSDHLFVHVCCAPCLANPLPRVLAAAARRTFYFDNPNIHPFDEFVRRANAVRHLLARAGEFLLVAAYDPRAYFDAVADNPRGGERCRACYRLRLSRAAEAARARGATHFTTSLLSSPFQKHDLVAEEAAAAAARFGLAFLYYDLRESYYDGVHEVRRLGLYRQSYCGCVFSEIERLVEKPRRALAASPRTPTVRKKPSASSVSRG